LNNSQLNQWVNNNSGAAMYSATPTRVEAVTSVQALAGRHQPV